MTRFIRLSCKEVNRDRTYLTVNRGAQFFDLDLPLQCQASRILPFLIELVTQILAGQEG